MIDWLGLSFTLLGSLSVIKKKKIGFLLMLIGCLCWIGFGIQVESIAVIITNIIFSVVNGFGYYRWNENDKNEIKKD